MEKSESQKVEVQKPKLNLNDWGDGISQEHKMEVINILETHDSASFLEAIVEGKHKYVVDVNKTIKVYQYLSQFYELPKYY